VQGRGRLVIGDDVLVDGKCSFTFAVRYTKDPTLRIGDHVRIGHNSAFTVGREITIGSHCLIASGVQMFDSPGHSTDPAARKAGEPARFEDVRPIRIEDGAWIGRNAVIFPGVTVGVGSVVATGSVVMSNVPPAVVVAGNPARQIARVGAEEREAR
jgi:acetyltransferase-like isoleucine patch superfamily enzyme